MLKKSASGVLASLRGPTYRSRTPRLFARCGLAGRTFWASCGVMSCCSGHVGHWISSQLHRFSASC